MLLGGETNCQGYFLCPKTTLLTSFANENCKMESISKKAKCHADTIF